MYARNVSLHLKANTAGEFTRTFEKDVLPLLRKQNGFKDEISFVAPDRSEAVAISLWDRKESADNYSRDIYPQVLTSLAKVVEGTPKVEAEHRRLRPTRCRTRPSTRSQATSADRSARPLVAPVRFQRRPMCSGRGGGRRVRPSFSSVTG